MPAREIALSAAKIAREAAELEAAHEEAIKEDARRARHAQHLERYLAALPILGQWFPGVSWMWQAEGDYGYDTIVYDASENWPPSFKLLVGWNPDRSLRIEVGSYRSDSSMPGYSYFAGSAVRSAADIGRYLEMHS
jgi:hypothetical protein